MNPEQRKVSFFKIARMLVTTAPQVYPCEVKMLQDGSTLDRDWGINLTLDRIKYILRGLVTLWPTREWFKFLGQPGMEFIAQERPRLFSKLQRPYLHRKLSQREQIQILMEHYRFALETFSLDSIKQIYSSRGLVLADLPLGEAGNYVLRLMYLFEKEGELSIVLTDKTAESVEKRIKKNSICAISFSITAYTESRREIFIGGLQSFNHFNDHIVPVTRAMHGLRPKALMLFAVQQLAVLWGIQTLRAVGNDMTVFRHIRLRKKNVQANYNEFWLESDGKLESDGMFTLPTAFVPRPIVEIRANKRGVYKKRYAMLEEISRQIADCASRYGPSN